VSRYRPPTTPGSKYITPQGAKRLRDELDQLWLEERPRVTIAVSEAAAQGDRSENAEYTYGKKRLHEIDRRVRFLRKRLEGMTIVDPAAIPAGPRENSTPAGTPAGGVATGRRDPRRVYFGAWVELEHANGELHWYRIVGPDEFDMASDYVSMDSPLGRALLGKRLDDEVTVALPTGPAAVIIVAISYGQRPRP
jgi:transcription elongation factor GreB